jgi:hypothetical protein
MNRTRRIERAASGALRTRIRHPRKPMSRHIAAAAFAVQAFSAVSADRPFV